MVSHMGPTQVERFGHLHDRASLAVPDLEKGRHLTALHIVVDVREHLDLTHRLLEHGMECHTEWEDGCRALLSPSLDSRHLSKRCAFLQLIHRRTKMLADELSVVALTRPSHLGD